jgi:hypothetical protein
MSGDRTHTRRQCLWPKPLLWDFGAFGTTVESLRTPVIMHFTATVLNTSRCGGCSGRKQARSQRSVRQRTPSRTFEPEFGRPPCVRTSALSSRKNLRQEIEVQFHRQNASWSHKFDHWGIASRFRQLIIARKPPAPQKRAAQPLLLVSN